MYISVDEWMYVWVDGWMDRQMDGQTDGWTDGRVVGYTCRWMNEREEGQMGGK